MAASVEQYEGLIRSAARRLKGHQRRLFQAEVADALCGGNPRAAETRFGWGRESVATGQHEARTGIRCVEDFPARGAPFRITTCPADPTRLTRSSLTCSSRAVPAPGADDHVRGELPEVDDPPVRQRSANVP